LTKELIVIIANCSPQSGEELGAPILQASVAAAMDYDVTVVCTATASKLMRRGVSEFISIKLGSSKTVYDFIKDARAAGVKFYCCAPNVDAFPISLHELIPECAGFIGGTQLIEQIMERDDVKVLSY
jgi:predicted peroxiredoxin